MEISITLIVISKQRGYYHAQLILIYIYISIENKILIAELLIPSSIFFHCLFER